VSDRGGAVVIDAENALGQVTAERAVKLAVERAKVHGLAAVTVRNGFHFGAAGRWAKAMAEAGCIGVALCNTRPLMPAPGGADRVVGNNPIAVAVPTADAPPITLDLALSAGAMGKIRLAEAAGDPIPEGWACDANGVPTTDAAAAIRGMLLPIGGPKGFGLAMIVELLAGGLSSGAMGSEVQPLYGDPSVPYRCAHFFLALDVSAFRDIGDYAAAAAEFAARIRQSRPAPGSPPVRVPGDRAPMATVRNAGICRLPASVAAALRTTAQRLGVAPPPALL
jgi:LDH2 family malate/lactate/ureidoglycolate dehydrogenase